MNSMKVLTSLAGVSALVCVANANALNINLYDEADPLQVTIRISGSTSHDPGLEKLWQLNERNLGICVEGTLDFFRSRDRRKRLAYCVGRPFPFLPVELAGKRLAIHKASEGGSGNGVAPLVRAPFSPGLPNPPDFWNVPTGGGATFLQACAGVTETPLPGTPFAIYTLHDDCPNGSIAAGTINNPAPDAGISDLEPAIFKTAFDPDLNAIELAAIPPKLISAVVMGVPVTLNIRNRMQALQFENADPPLDVCHPSHPNYGDPVVPDPALPESTITITNAESGECQPSLYRSQLAALYSGSFFNWSQITSPTTPGEDLTNLEIPNVPDNALSDRSVFWCRRVDTSGTQASFETYMLGQRCADGVPPFVTAALDPAQVTESSGSSEVVRCLNTKFAAREGAIGVLSLEFLPGTSDNFRFIKVGAKAPCLLEIVKSSYDFVAESTMQWRTVAIAGLPRLRDFPLRLALVQQIRKKMGRRAVIQDLNTAFKTLFCGGSSEPDEGSGALLGNALSANVPPTTPFVAEGGGTDDVQVHPILTKTRGLNGPNSCGRIIDVYPTEIELAP